MKFLRAIYNFLFPPPPHHKLCDMCGKEPATVAKSEDYAVCDTCDSEANAV